MRLLTAARRAMTLARLSVAIGGMLVLAACGGAAGPGGSGGPGQGTPGGPGGGAGGPGATTTGGGGGSVLSDVCRLLTVDEVAGALSTDPILTAGPDPNWDAGCVYSLAPQDEALVVRVVSQDADAYFAAMAEGREAVDGVADGGVYSTSDRELSIRTGGVVVRMRAVYASDAVTTLANLKALAAIVIARVAGTAVPPESQITAPPLLNAATACDLLSKEDVARILDKGPIAVVDTAGAQFCSYTLEATGEYLAGIYLDRKGGIKAWQDLLAEGTTEHVDGLGNDAAYEAFNRRLSVQVGDQIMHVELYVVGDDEALGLARQLMEIMLRNL